MVPLNQKRGRHQLRVPQKMHYLKKLNFLCYPKLILEWMNVTKGNRTNEKLKKKNLIVKMFYIKPWPLTWSNCHITKNVWWNTKCRMFCTNVKCPLWNSKCDRTALIRIKTNSVCTLQWHRRVTIVWLV